MSRLYFTLTMPHERIGKGLPTISFDTNDHTGGGYNVGGIFPSHIATMVGKGPDIKKGERFDIKANCNKKRYGTYLRRSGNARWQTFHWKLTFYRSSLTLVVNTSKLLPCVTWSSEGGAGTSLISTTLTSMRPSTKGTR